MPTAKATTVHLDAARVSASKRALRERVLAARDALDPTTRAAKSAAVCADLAALLDRMLAERQGLDHSPAVAPSLTIAVYAAMRSELDLRAFAEEALERGCALAYPCMVRNPAWSAEAAQEIARKGGWLPRTLMEFRAVRAHEDLEAAPFIARPLRTYEPDSVDLAAWPPVAAQDVDLVACPLVAFEENGARLGYGGGNYDALLGELREDALVIGVAFAEQRVADGQIPREPHDRPLPGVLSA